MPPSKIDQELTGLLTKLYTIQEDVGAKPKSSEEEKQKKAQNVATMGKGRKAGKTGSKFLELKSSIVEKLKAVHELLQQQADREAGRVSVAGGNNPKDIIAAQATIREHIRGMQEDWSEMDALYKNEARKKRSKFTQAELEVQQTLVLQLQSEIEKVKEIQQRGFVRGVGGDDSAVAATLNTKALAALDAADLMSNSNAGNGNGTTDWASGGGGGGGGGGGEEAALTDGQRVQIQQIDDRDAEFDQQIDEIGDGIQDLAEIAEMQGEEVKRQNMMLDNVGNRLDSVHEHVTNVNSKMKETLSEVGRSGDKLCVDIMCIVLAVGFAAVFYNMAKNS